MSTEQPGTPASAPEGTQAAEGFVPQQAGLFGGMFAPQPIELPEDGDEPEEADGASPATMEVPSATLDGGWPAAPLADDDESLIAEAESLAAPDEAEPPTEPVPTREPSLLPSALPSALPSVAEAPSDWGVVGQRHVVDALRRAIEADRLAHAYLLSGPRGVGKATLARRLAQALVCAQPRAVAAPCLECRACRQIEAGEASDVEVIRIGGVCDEAGPAHNDHAADRSTRIRICQVRRLERVAALAPFAAPRRIFVIDAADDLQPEAAHAVLKTLEEPPGQAVLVLLATDPDALLPTIRSRCQELVLRPSPVDELAEALVARFAGGDRPVDAAQVHEAARAAGGRFGLAVTLLTDPTTRVMRESALADLRRLLPAGRNERFDHADTLAGRWQKERESVLAVLDTWSGWWRDRLLAAAGLPVDVPADLDGDAGEGAEEGWSAEQAVGALEAIQRTRQHLLQNTNAQLALEVLMLDLPLLARKEVRAGATSA